MYLNSVPDFQAIWDSVDDADYEMDREKKRFGRQCMMHMERMGNFVELSKSLIWKFEIIERKKTILPFKHYFMQICLFSVSLHSLSAVS